MNTETCRNRHPDGLFVCTLPAGHSGNHIAEGLNDEVLATWPQADDAATAPAPPAQEPWHPGECLTCRGRVDHAGVFHKAGAA